MISFTQEINGVSFGTMKSLLSINIQQKIIDAQILEVLYTKAIAPQDGMGISSF